MGRTLARIVLIGLRGSGKSTVGCILARGLGVPFHDSDAEMSVRYGKTAGEMIRGEGEAKFRRREHRVVAELAALPSGVLALGGGAPCDPRTREALASWTAVLLDAPDSVLRTRIDGDARSDDPVDRPPLTDTGDDEIAVLRRRRWEHYLALDPIVVDANAATPEQIVANILDAIENAER